MEPVKMVVHFADGGIKKGYSQDFFPNKSVFHLSGNPARRTQEPEEIRMKIFAVNASVREFRFLGSETTPAGAKNQYQCLIPEARGKLLMVSGEERRVLRLILSRVLETESGREYIIEKLGDSYLKIAQELLEEMDRD